MKKILLSFLMCFLLIFTTCSAPKTDNPETAPAPSSPEPLETSQPKPQPEPKEEFLLSAYLPVNAVDDPGKISSESLALLDYVILNTGVYWDENGSLLIDDSLSSLVETLSPQVKIFCTINPKGSLIRDGKVLSTLDTEEKRQALSRKIADFARENHLSGIDIDWEFPAENEWEVFGQFLLELDKALGDVSLSLAFYPENISLPKTAFSAVDQIHIMAYDLFDEQGFHSTLETAEKSIQYFTELGFLPQQLSLGIPAYGRPLDQSAQWLFYRDIDLDAVGENPNLINDFYFNSPQLAAQKVALAKENHLGGAMLYHLLCDKTDENSLILAMSKAKM